LNFIRTVAAPSEERFDAHDVERRQDERPPDRIALHRCADLANRSHHAIDVLAVGNPHVDDRVGVLLAEVGERRDGTVREDLHGALRVAQDDRAEVDLLDAAADAVDAREIADAHLIFEDQEKIPR